MRLPADSSPATTPNAEREKMLAVAPSVDAGALVHGDGQRPGAGHTQKEHVSNIPRIPRASVAAGAGDQSECRK